MVKAYLRYVPQDILGLISGHSSNILFTKKGNLIIAASNEIILLINPRTNEIVSKLYDNEKEKKSEITQLTLSDDKFTFYIAAGHMDGDIALWDFETLKLKTYLSGHRSQVSSMVFRDNNSTLISGSYDNNIIIWDIITESALFKLEGHKNAITKLMAIDININEGNSKMRDNQMSLILSSSKDGLFKVWDLAIQDCIATFPGSTNEIWSFEYIQEHRVVLLSTNLEDIQILKLTFDSNAIKGEYKVFKELEKFQRHASARVINMQLDPDRSILYILNVDKSVEMYRIQDEKELAKKLKRKKKRAKEKNKGDEIDNLDLTEYSQEFSNHLQYVTTTHFPHKVRSIVFTGSKLAEKSNCYVNLHNNSIASYAINKTEAVSAVQAATDSASVATPGFHVKKTFESGGHRTPVRTISISFYDTMILTGSSESIKLWTTSDFKCFRTFESTYCTCSTFIPEDRYFMIGDKNGALFLYDINKAELVQKVQAHTASIWSIHLHEAPQGQEGLSIITGSADKGLKFWDIIVTKHEELELREAKHIQMVDEIHCVKYSPDGKHYAASLLDSTIKIYFSDSDRLFLSLYGHKLPALSFDISSDNTLLVSGSADKNVRIWGMDFGNCRKSIFAHNDSIMSVQFVKDTHYFFSASKDRVVKLWDGDTYQLILDFESHLADVWAVAVSSIGDFFVSASNDKSIRVWKQTKEQVFVAEEEEKRQEKMMIEGPMQEKFNMMEDEANKGQGASDVTRLKLETLKYGENVIAAIDLAEEMREEYMQYELGLKDYLAMNPKKRDNTPKPERPKMERLGGLSIPEFVLKEINKINSNQLENCLKFLHFTHIEKLLYYLKYFIQNNINIELSTRILYFILQNYESQIKSSPKLVQVLANIQKNLRSKLKKSQDTLGYNISGIKIFMKVLKERDTSQIEQDDIFKTKTEF